MSAFDTLLADVRCPNCRRVTRHVVEVKMAECDQKQYRIGEALRYPPSDGQRRGTEIVFEEGGFGQCPNCLQQSFMDVVIENGKFKEVHIVRLAN